jgi:hypothetical protein
MSKKPKSKGALKHGAYVQEVILPGEDGRDYELMLCELYEEWAPQGLTEKELVERLASLYWRSRRVHLYEQAKLQQRADNVRRKNEWVDHKQFLKTLVPEFAAAASAKGVERILTKNAAYRDIIISWVPRDPAKDETKWGPAIADHLSKLEIGSRLEGADAFVSIVDMNPLQMEFDWKMSDRLDENIDRTIKRLLQVKTNKQLFPNLRKDARLSSKFVDVSPNNDNGSAPAIEKEHGKELPAAVEEDTKPASDNEPKPLNYNDVVLKTS